MTRPEDLEREVGRLQNELDAARTQADQWREVAEQRRVVLERWRQHPVVRVLFTLRSVAGPLWRRVRAWRRRLRGVVAGVRRLGGSVRGLAAQRGRRRRRHALERAIRTLDARRPVSLSATVSLVIVTRDGGPDLGALLDRLDQTSVQPHGAEVVVVDNGGGQVARDLESRLGDRLRMVVLEEPTDFGTANNRGVEASTGQYLCFLNDDVYPCTRDWLADLAAPVVAGDAVMAGAQLLYAPQQAMARRYGDYTVQHAGIVFDPAGLDVPTARNVAGDVCDVATSPRQVAAVTAACSLVSRQDFDAAGGFAETYDFGAEDVDLCWRLRAGGAPIVLVPPALLLHLEGATRLRDDVEVRRRRQAENWRTFEGRLGPAVWHAVARDRVDGRSSLTHQRLRVAITVTRDDPGVAYGDLQTARALRDELETCGWDVTFVERYRDAWYDLPDVDVVVVLLDTFDVRRVARPGLVVIAWARNWETRWAAHPWADRFDLVLCSGEPEQVAPAFVPHGVPVERFPLATDPDVFRDMDRDRHGIVLPAHYWGEDRGIPPLVAAVPGLRLLGKGWDALPEVAEAWSGPLPSDQMPRLFAEAEVVVDVAAVHTRQGGSVNARVFDALAAGAVVVSNQPGVTALFGEDVPVFADAADLAAILDAHARDPEPLRQRAARARDVVLSSHTWHQRAGQLQQAVGQIVDAPRVALLTGAPDGAEGRRWGDTHLAEAMARPLRLGGLRPEVVARPHWDTSAVRACDVTVHLKGRGRAPAHPGQVNVIWVISHPEELADDELADADLVLAGSQPLADHLRHRTTTPVEVLRQATDPHRFRPGRDTSADRVPVVFVGNSRFAERPIVAAALDSEVDVVIHGANWDRFAPASAVRRDHVPNEELAAVYGGAGVVLNDHWDTMRRWGLVSNRIFDAVASGACVLSDEVDELAQVLPGGVVTVSDPSQVGEALSALLDDPQRRERVAAEGRRRVLAEHTFSHRVDELLGHMRRHDLLAP